MSEEVFITENAIIIDCYIDILKEHNIEILIAGKRVLINEIPYIEDRIKHCEEGSC